MDSTLLTFPGVSTHISDLWEKLSQHMCLWCCCRYLGIRNISFYKLNINTALDELRRLPCLDKANITLSFTEEGSVCGGCYGILTKYTAPDFLQQVYKEVVDQAYEFEHFCCSLAVPVAAILRDFSYLILCSEICPFSLVLIRSTKRVDRFCLSSLEECFLWHNVLETGLQEAYSYLPMDQVPAVKDVWKWMCGPKIERLLNSKFELNHLDILIDFTQADIEKELDRVSIYFHDHFMKKKSNKKNTGHTRTDVLRAVQSVSRDKLKTLIPHPPVRLSSEAIVTGITCSHSPVYVAGRYNKYSRTLSQSPWVVDGERRGDTSVSELLSEPILRYTKASSNYFSSSGREDIDVKMLGSGRPFMLQLINPKKLLTPDLLRSFQSTLNSSTDLIAVHHLQLVTREDCDVLKDLEEEKRKTYLALCRSETPLTQSDLDKLSNLKDVVLDQMTPIRVLHRRALAHRPRTVHYLKAQLSDESNQLFTLEIETQGGTYIKEFVHGDFGRTVPDLGTLLDNRTVDILTLDVLSVHVDWPPALEEDSKVESTTT